MNSLRTKLTVLALACTLLAYVPVCCCWTESVTAWMAGGLSHACGTACCGHHGSAAPAGSHDDHNDRPQRAPGHLTDCFCGVQHRIVNTPAPSPLDFEPALVGFIESAAPMLGAAPAARANCAPSEWSWAADAGARSLLRLHCALLV